MKTHGKGETFRALHERDRAFVIPNPWDIGTAKLLASAGFEALATTSAGYAFSTGRADGAVGRSETRAILNGSGADCRLDGIYLGTGNQVLDNTTYIEHVAAGCRSRQV